MPGTVPIARTLALLSLLLCASAASGAEKVDRKRIEALATRWFQARPKTAFGAWDPKTRAALLEEARALGPIPEGSLGEVRDLLWKAVQKHGPRAKGEEIETPYGKATWIQKGRGGPRSALVIGLHGGGPGAGNAGEAAGNWPVPGALCLYPQGIRLVNDTWNTVHGERFVLTLIEIAKAQHGIDPDRVYVMGFSMGGTGSWFMAGRHPDLLAGAIPAHGVLMAEPKSQAERKEDVVRLQHGFVRNVRNLALWSYTGLEDRNCRPWTFVIAHEQVLDLAKDDPGGYALVRFTAHPGVAHAFPAGEPQAGIEFVTARARDAFPRKIVYEHVEEPFPLPDAEDRSTRLPKRWHYWLTVDRTVDAMEVEAVRDGNRIDLSVARAFAEDVTVWLNPSMIDVSQDVVLNVDGKEVWRGRPQPDVATVLESLDARLDRTLVFDRRIRVPER